VLTGGATRGFVLSWHSPVSTEHPDRDETYDAAWTDPRRLAQLPVHPGTRPRIADAVTGVAGHRHPDRLVDPNAAQPIRAIQRHHREIVEHQAHATALTTRRREIDHRLEQIRRLRRPGTCPADPAAAARHATVSRIHARAARDRCERQHDHAALTHDRITERLARHAQFEQARHDRLTAKTARRTAARTHSVAAERDPTTSHPPLISPSPHPPPRSTSPGGYRPQR
jgi:hypothetical protein